MFPLDKDQPDVSPIVDYARDLEKHAPWAGSVQPTVDECRAFLRERSRDPHFPPSDASPSQVLDCITHPRSTFECLRAARDVGAADACP